MDGPGTDSATFRTAVLPDVDLDQRLADILRGHLELGELCVVAEIHAIEHVRMRQAVGEALPHLDLRAHHLVSPNGPQNPCVEITQRPGDDTGHTDLTEECGGQNGGLHRLGADRDHGARHPLEAQLAQRDLVSGVRADHGVEIGRHAIDLILVEVDGQY